MKKIEEAAKESVSKVLTVKENESVYLETSDINDYLIDQFEEGVKFAQRWIPVEEELPTEFEKQILVKNEQYNFVDLRFFKGRTQIEVAGELKISQAQVSRLEKNALKSMRNYLA